MKPARLIAIAAAIAAIGAAASAQPLVTEPVGAVTIPYANLDLGTAGGAERLALRIRTAANKLCGGESPVTRTSDAIADCRRATEERAVAGLDAPMVRRALDLPPAAARLASR